MFISRRSRGDLLARAAPEVKSETPVPEIGVNEPVRTRHEDWEARFRTITSSLRAVAQVQRAFIAEAAEKGVTHANTGRGGPLADAFAAGIQAGVVPAMLYKPSRGAADTATFLDPTTIKGSDFIIEYYPNDKFEPIAVTFIGNRAVWQGSQFVPPVEPDPDSSTAEVVRYQASGNLTQLGPSISPITDELLLRVEVGMSPPGAEAHGQ